MYYRRKSKEFHKIFIEINNINVYASSITFNMVSNR